MSCFALTKRARLTRTDVRTLRIATRTSTLALVQTNLAGAAIRGAHPGVSVELVEVTTRGDRDQATPLRAMGGEGVFVAAVRDAVRDGRADVAMHSLKDMPSASVPGLVIGAMLERADPRDVFVGRGGRRLRDLPAGARVGTSATRRAAILRAMRPDLEIAEIRGNVDTRLAKVERGEYDGAILAAAGLLRLGRLNEATEIYEAQAFLPSPGQGVIALECRADDTSTRILLEAIDHAPTRVAATAERAVLAALGAGCQLGVAAYAQHDDELLTVRAMLAPADADGMPVFGDATGRASEAAALGFGLGERLKAALEGGVA
ncbi:MAG: hydroxymethylbilane synthase [Chloroflexi bacterium]|nr:hydroxymethylbilane synthase [Chloroflexota bacterium]